MTADLFAVGQAAMPVSGAILAPFNGAAADPPPIEFGTQGATGLTLVTDITAQSGANNALAVNLEGFDPASGKWITLAAPVYTAVGTYPVVLDPRYDSGIVREVTIASPAAGAQPADQTVPAGTTWELLSYSYQLAASVAAANRFPHLKITDAADVYLAGDGAGSALTASTTTQVSFTRGVATVMANVVATAASRLEIAVPYPGLIQPGWKVKSDILALDAADAITNVRMVVIERAVSGLQAATPRAPFQRMRVRPIKSGTTTTLVYSIGATLYT